MNIGTNMNNTSDKYTQILANPQEYHDKSECHQQQIDMKLTAYPHEYCDKSE